MVDQSARAGRQPGGAAPGFAHAGLTGSFLLDRDGRVLEADGAPVSACCLADLVPEFDAAEFARWRIALDGFPAAVLRLDFPRVDAPAVSLRVEREIDGRYLATLGGVGDGDGDGYRERLENRLVFEHMIAALSTELIHAPSERLDGLIEQALGRIGSFFGVDRAYLFRFSGDRASMDNTHEWVEEGISREAHKLQQVPMDHFGWLMRELLAGRFVHIPVVADLPPEAATEAAEFEREGIRSLVLVPFGEAQAPEGFIGFDSVRRERHWSADILLGLRLVGQMFYNALRAQVMSNSLITLASLDPLTGLGNRRLLGEQLAYALERSQREQTRLAVVLVDLDDFKLVNDSYGHSLGDEILKTVASRLAASVPAADSIARLGGDEFVLVVHVDALDSLVQQVERLFEAMREPVELRGMRFVLRMSAGIALYPADATDAEALLRQADTAMYAAKAGGRDRHAFFAPPMALASRTTLTLRHELQRALERDEIRPYYQPRVALSSSRVLGFEALARWHHPERGVLLPGEFLEIAAQGGMLGRIDQRILAHALADLAGWRRSHPDCMVSVNLDASDLQDEALVAGLLQQLDTAGDLADAVEIEITETSLMRNIEQAARTLARLREAAPGLRIAIDDFGSGYSSLAYVGRLPVATLKIDRSFVAELGGGNPRNARAIIHSIVDLSRSLGLHVIAEGVETIGQADELRRLDCLEAQGFLFAPGLPHAQASALLQAGFVTAAGVHAVRS
ncbi:MAG: EAL domain-containing protein [Thermomonas sp.]|uniref:putative bifunctional diguanylate cyclase/phosphodiesterase n=1 Tax=Thermomonas sp. TaxID=1971895 RepID=UPI001B61694D|nr:EAL domain-containing protein [Thermomonas sp.]MBP7159324.1 EAL domain-containing protein [Thermomonas sp.]MBP8648780.1 EAL domain-containing protein [Thermomonas sp.]